MAKRKLLAAMMLKGPGRGLPGGSIVVELGNPSGAENGDRIIITCHAQPELFDADGKPRLAVHQPKVEIVLTFKQFTTLMQELHSAGW